MRVDDSSRARPSLSALWPTRTLSPAPLTAAHRVLLNRRTSRATLLSWLAGPSASLSLPKSRATFISSLATISVPLSPPRPRTTLLSSLATTSVLLSPLNAHSGPLSPPGRGLFAMTCERRGFSSLLCTKPRASHSANRVRGIQPRLVTPSPFAPRGLLGPSTTSAAGATTAFSHGPRKPKARSPLPQRRGRQNHSLRDTDATCARN